MTEKRKRPALVLLLSLLSAGGAALLLFTVFWDAPRRDPRLLRSPSLPSRIAAALKGADEPQVIVVSVPEGGDDPEPAGRFAPYRPHQAPPPPGARAGPTPRPEAPTPPERSAFPPMTDRTGLSAASSASVGPPARASAGAAGPPASGPAAPARLGAKTAEAQDDAGRDPALGMSREPAAPAALRARANAPSGTLTSFLRNMARGLLGAGSAEKAAPEAVPAAEGARVGMSLYARASGADLRSKPMDSEGTDSLRLSQLVQGETLTVLGETQDGWVHVRSSRLTEYDEKSGQWHDTEGWVRREALGADRSLAVPREPVAPSEAREAFVRSLMKFEGTPYVWGGTSPGRDGGVDCSGLVVAALTDIGYRRIPRTAADQERAARPLGDLSQLKPGDLIFDGNPAHHVIVYVGGGRTIEAMGRKWGVVVMDAQRRLQTVRQPYFGALLAD